MGKSLTYKLLEAHGVDTDVEQGEEVGGAALFILQNDYYDGRILEIDGALRL